MKRRQNDLAAGRAFRRMALFLAILIIGGVTALFIWVKEPPGTTNPPDGGPTAAGASSSGGPTAR
ncbi:hypothetical protein C7T35_33200 [Variovorax sp. WS11]|uniref:hypothetical protein n=1 Tax=Variovorax sp. WS11 TaxID=1105204 RepID=UPI000D2A6842|nr:hypothetical protein [Variovorax sp. WS11]NDZ17831.1 hypothetical protein [Variovorax sp. WS11]PSL80270.1 hypothetical protein C7T35_33200 [Variovorax sp. WS11]